MSVTFADAKKLTDTIIQELGGYWPPLANVARLFEECGEISRAVNVRYGPKRAKTQETPADLGEELGDALFALIVLANSADIDIEESFLAAAQKYRQRDIQKLAKLEETE